MPFRTAFLCACLALAVLPAGCGSDKLDTSRLESQIKTTLSDRTGVPIESVVCPGEVEAKKGDRFTCTATTARKERVVLDVTQDDDAGSVTWKIAKGR